MGSPARLNSKTAIVFPKVKGWLAAGNVTIAQYIKTPDEGARGRNEMNFKSAKDNKAFTD